jgi:GNAT superfamily N-acetyltransferase
VKVRPARPSDQAALKAFRCADNTHHQVEVERWFCHKALKWSARQPLHHLLLLVDADEPIGGVCYEPGDDPGEWFVMALAISKQHQGKKLGKSLLTTCPAQLAVESPGGVAYWKVDPDNAPSIAMSNGVGAEPEDVPGEDLLLFTVPLEAEPELDLDEAAGVGEGTSGTADLGAEKGP